MKLELVGEWHLTGYAYVSSSLKPDDPPDDSDVEGWLFAAVGDHWPEMEVWSGVELVIRDDATYSEQVVGEPFMLWYDSDGVQVESPEPTEGVVREGGGHDWMSLHPENATNQDSRTEDRFRGALRCDDGDTMICDTIRVVGDSLIRAISVVTDEMYQDRVVVRYDRRLKA